MQIYGIDLAKSKFDVSFSRFDAQGTPTTPGHKIVQNNASGIKKFLAKLPKDATLVAEHTGVYGELLLKMCDDNSVPIALVGGYVIHTYKSAPDRRKTDEADCAVLREFGERFYDRLNFCNFPEKDIYELQQLASHRERLIEERKRQITLEKSEKLRVSMSSTVRASLTRMKEFLDKEIDAIEQQMLSIIEENKELKRNYDIITSVKGVGMVTAIDLITNTRNFTKIKTAHEYASYAGTAPFEKSSGTMNRGAHISSIGNRRAKTLLYICAESARIFNQSIKLYYVRRTQIEKKHHYYVLNAIANKLLRIIFSLVKKGEKFDQDYQCKDPRSININ